MCGIVGYIGKKIDAKFVIEKLKLLEYRGYDSAGISGILNDEKNIFKQVGPIDNLSQVLPKNWKVDNAIAHTRWATHGECSKNNAHPHTSFNNEWTIVHNGIIKNCDELKAKLVNQPIGETDTEILVEFLSEQRIEDINDFVDAFEKVEGTYALICQHNSKSNELFIAKKSSPIYISQNQKGDILIASDPMCFRGFCDEYFVFEDDEFAYIKNKKIKFYDKNKKIIKKNIKILKNDYSDDNLLNCEHFMLKEIFEQPDALKRLVECYKKEKILEQFDGNFLKNFNQVKLLGCGTAYHACLVGAKYIEKILHIPASAEIASEFVYNENTLDHKKTLFLFVSQSGETADTLHALQIEKKLGATCVAVTNVGYSSLAQSANYVLPICAGQEIAVASTKAYTCQLATLYLFTKYFNGEIEDAYQDILRIKDKLLDFDKSAIEKIAKVLVDKKDVVFIGKDIDFVTAREGGLKLKEITYINATSSPSGELKHGYLALVESGMPVVVVATNPKINYKSFDSASEAEARGGKKIVFSNETLDCEYFVKVPNESELLMPLISVVPLQYLAYQVSVMKGINPDKPRNLAKSVTVE